MKSRKRSSGFHVEGTTEEKIKRRIAAAWVVFDEAGVSEFEAASRPASLRDGQSGIVLDDEALITNHEIAPF